MVLFSTLELFRYKCIPILADMCGLEMVISLLEIQRNELAYWQVKELDGVCTLPDSGWQKNGNTASFSHDLGSVTRMMENVPIFMTPPKLQSAQST